MLKRKKSKKMFIFIFLHGLSKGDMGDRTNSTQPDTDINATSKDKENERSDKNAKSKITKRKKLTLREYHQAGRMVHKCRFCGTM